MLSSRLACPLLFKEGVCYREKMHSPLLLLILALFVAPGCLYIGGINHDPEGEVTLEASSARLEVKGRATLKAQVSDPDGDTLTYEWRAEVVDPQGVAWVLTRASSGNDSDKNVKKRSSMSAPVIGEQSSLPISPLPLLGKYTVTVRFTDDRGAAVERKLSFEVKNTAPTGIQLGLEADPEFREQDQVPDHGGSFPVHAHYRAFLKKATDLEGDLICGQGASVVWTLEHGTTLVREYKQVQTCSGQETFGVDKLRFRFKPTKLTAAQPLTIKAAITDSHGGTASGELKVSLAPNRPPCILGSLPSFKDALNVAPKSAEQNLFEAAPVDDDVAWGIHYNWSVRDKGAAGFTVLPGQRGAKFEMPAWFRLPGDELELRVMVLDSLSPLPVCGLTENLCAPHKGLPEACYQGITWKVRMQ